MCSLFPGRSLRGCFLYETVQSGLPWRAQGLCRCRSGRYPPGKSAGKFLTALPGQSRCRHLIRTALFDAPGVLDIQRYVPLLFRIGRHC